MPPAVEDEASGAADAAAGAVAGLEAATSLEVSGFAAVTVEEAD